MKLIVAAVSGRPPDWVKQGWDDYCRRLPRDCSLVLRQVKPEPRNSGKTAVQIMQAEATRLKSIVPPGALTIALDEKGKDIDTAGLSRQLESWLQNGQDIVFFIGGPDGLDPALKRETNQTLKLSSLTLPHPLVRVILAEQLYRAWSLLNNHPYHRA